jgi:hypothetical protein
MVSVSGPGMKTMDGVFAESIGKQHRLILFLLEWPVAKDRKVVIRKLLKPAHSDLSKVVRMPF